MKRFFYIILLITICISASYSYLWAIKATANIVKYKQPDGSIISLKVVGDELLGYTTLLNGDIVAKGKDGYIYYANYNSGYMQISSQRVNGSGTMVKSDNGKSVSKVVPLQIASSLRSYASDKLNIAQKTNQRTIRPANTLDISNPSLVLLVQFADKSFSINNTKSYFSDLLNGKAAQYFNDNYRGKAVFTFDLSDIITVSKDVAYYGEKTEYLSDANVASLVVEACKIASANGVDFSLYDIDKDGQVDNVAIIFAGINEAESGDNSTIWPHKGDISDKNIFCDGVKIASYTCSSEYSGDQVNYTPSTIGSFCHEFAHSLGLVDMYDVNGEEEGASNGLYGNLSLMDRGNYLNGGTTPPYFNAIEREILGIAEIADLNDPGEYTINGIQESDIIYRVPSVNEGEYFLLECRNGDNWDEYIGGSGMIVYHIDKSSSVYGGLSASSRWKLNIVNSYAEHECAKIIVADPDAVTGAGNSAKSNVAEGYDIASIFFPGSSNITSLSYSGTPPFTDWQQVGLGVSINNIKYENGKVSFTVHDDIVYREGTLSATDIQIIPYQQGALLSWKVPVPKSKYNGEWVITNETTNMSYSTDTTYFLLDNLELNTEYDCSIYFVENNYMGDVLSFKFKTDDITSAYPFIKLSERYRVGDLLNVCVQNLVEPYSSIEIKINGENLSGTLYKLEEKGICDVEVSIKYPDKSVDVITKKIEVL